MSVQRGYPNAGHYYSNLVGPVRVDMSFVVDPTNTNGLGVSSLKSNGYVRNVFMHTSATPGSNDGALNPNPANGVVMIQLKNNFNKFIGGLAGFMSQNAGGALNISGSGLTANAPYVITSVGDVPKPHFSVVTLADSSGSLASKYLLVSDAFSNNYVLYFVVSGVGSPPALVGSLANYVAVPVAISTNDANTAVATALGTSIGALNGSNSFTASVGGHTVTVTSKAASSLALSPAPQDVSTGFTVNSIVFTSLAADWQGIGLPAGLVPAVGQAFIASSTGGALGTGQVKAPGVSGIVSMEVIGAPNASIATSSIAQFGGSIVLVQMLADTSASVTTKIPAAPAAGSVCNLSFLLDNSAVTVDGL